MPDQRHARIRELIEPLRVKPGRRVRLPKDFDPAYTGTLVKKEESTELLAEGVRLLAEYQTRLAAQDAYGLLVIFQAMDAAGKDGTIRHVMSGVNPQGVRVSSFRAPSAEELDHDYLWRATKSLPSRGIDRDLQPLVLRGGPRRPRPPGAPRQAEAPDLRARQGRLGAPLS